MPKYRALQLIWSLELEQYIEPDVEFEVQNDETFPALIEAGVIEPVVGPSRRRKIEVESEPQVMEESNGSNN